MKAGDLRKDYITRELDTSMYYPDEEDREDLEDVMWLCPVKGLDCEELSLCENCYHKGKYSCLYPYATHRNIFCRRFSCKYLKAETMSVRCIKEEK